MKKLYRVLKFFYQYPYVLLAFIIIGFVAHLAYPDCIVPSDSDEDVDETNTSVLPINDYWVSSGVKVSSTDRLSITTSGSIFLCPLEEQTANWSMPANTFYWTNLGMTVIAGDGVTTGTLLRITPGEPNYDVSCGSITASDNRVKYSGNGDCYDNGALLTAAILPDGVDPSNTSPDDINATYGDVSFNLDKGLTTTSWGTSDPDSEYTLYGGYDGHVKYTGRLWVRISDTVNSGDNKGGYSGTITIQESDGCMASNGVVSSTETYTSYGNLQAVISDGDPATNSYTTITLTDGQYNPDDEGMYAPTSGTIWLKIHDADYSDNSGDYSVKVKATRDASSDALLSNVIMDTLVSPIMATLNSAVSAIYQKLIQDTRFVEAVRAALLLYIIMYFLMFVVGLVHISQPDLVIRAVKIGTVLTLISPISWDFFYDHFFSMFVEGGAWLLNVTTGAMGSSDNPLAFIDQTLGRIWQEDTILLLMGVSMTLPLGIVYVWLLIDAMWMYTRVICGAMMGLIMAFIALSVLLVMAPFFISFILFKDTQELFTKWVSLLFRYTLEPVIVIVGITIINEMIIITLDFILNNAICWKCAIGFNIPGYGNLFCLEYWMLWGYDNDNTGYNLVTTTSITLTNILILEMLTQLLKDFIELAPRIAAKLTATSPVMGTNFFGRGSVSDKAGESLKEGGKGLIGKDKNSIERREREKMVDKKAKEELDKENKELDKSDSDSAPTSGSAPTAEKE